MDNSKKLVVKGVFWNGVQLVINQSFGFLVKLVLAKVLFPEQFGIVGMATVFTGFVQVFNDLGIGAALVQRKAEDLREDHFHTAFWTGVFWSAGLYLIISFIVAPMAASFYSEPILKQLIPVLSIGVLSVPVNLVHKAQLTKEMNFKKMAFIDNVSNIIAGILSLLLAFLGFGVWSLAFNSIASIIIAMPLYFRATSWMPKFIWNKKSFKDVFGFGVYTTGTSVVNYLINNIDYLLIGKLLSAQLLGAYTFAFVLTDTFRSRLMSVINNVMYPFYGKNQSNPDALKRYYLMVVNYNSVLVYPIMVFMFSLGQPFVLKFFGEKWMEAIEPLKLLSLSVMVHMLVNSNTALIRGMGRPGLELKLQLFKAVIFVPMLVAGIVYYGIIGAAWAILINKAIAFLVAQYSFNYLLKIKVSILDFFRAVKSPWIASVASYLTVYLLYNVLNIHYILAAGCLLVVYSGVIWLLMGKQIQNQIKEFKSSKKS